jgi:RNA polymerase sigma-70 factor (ECF subfamily)
MTQTFRRPGGEHRTDEAMMSGATPLAVERLPITLGPDEQLLRQLRAGDDAAYEELVRKEMPHLLAVARRLLRNDEDAQDAVQQAFLSAFRALPAFNGQSRLTTWLHRIEELLPNFLDDGHHVEQFSEWTLPADARMVRHETRTHVRAAIDRLPDSYRTVLLLRDIEELSTEETAQALGVTSNTVKIRLHRARQALLKLLTPSMARSHTAPREVN